MGFRDWSTADVVRQLKTLGFGQYIREFQTNEICGVHLPLLTEDHLKEMGVTSIGHRILIRRRFADIIAGRTAPEPRAKPHNLPKIPEKAPQKTVASDSSSAKSSERNARKTVPKKMTNQNDDQDNKVPCPYCGKSFFPDLAQRHVNVCARYNSKVVKK
jgi:hypothetical protein